MKRMTPGNTERWPIVAPSGVQVIRRVHDAHYRRWDDREVFVAFMAGALSSLALVATLALSLVWMVSL